MNEKILSRFIALRGGVWIFSETTQRRKNGSSLLSHSFFFSRPFILRAAPNYLNARNRLLFIQCASQAKPENNRNL